MLPPGHDGDRAEDHADLDGSGRDKPPSRPRRGRDASPFEETRLPLSAAYDASSPKQLFVGVPR